jgi:hypothetical protein
LCVVALALLAWSKNEGLMLALALALPAALSLRRGSALPAVRRPPHRSALATEGP